ncbi:MAG: hypothetical protein EXS25_01725 [Pedosphaera sp.]|nr:hypothetical protein [Pedosphaera sp.]
MRSKSDFDTLLERAIAVLLLGAVAWSVLWFGGVEDKEFSFAVGSLGIASALWVVRLWVDDSSRFLLPPVTWIVPIFLGYAFWRCSTAEVQYMARMELFLICTCVLAFVTALHTLHRQETGSWFVHGIVLIGTLVSVYALVQCLRQSNSVLGLERPVMYLKRYGGTFVNPNHLAGFLLVAMPLALANGFLSRGSTIVKILHGYAALVMLAAIAFTMSRGGWIGTLVSLGVFSIWLIRRPQFRIPVAIFAILLVAAVTLFISYSSKARARLDDVTAPAKFDSGLSRLWLWRPVWRMWEDNWLLGVGPGQFDSRFPAYRTAENPLNPQHVHNEFLEVLVEYGAVGGMLVGLGGILFIYGLWRTSKHVERGASDLAVKASNRTAFFAGAVTAVTGFSVHCLFEFNLHIPANAVLVALLLGMLVSNLRFATERYWLTSNLFTRLVATALVLGAGYWMLPVAIARARESRHLVRATAMLASDEAFFDELRAADTANPGNPLTTMWYGEEKRRVSWLGAMGWEIQATEAIEWLEKTSRLNPYNARAHMRLALCHQWLGAMDRAKVEIEKAAVLGPNDIEIANALAWNRLSRKDYAGAREAVVLSLRINPWNNWEARSYEAKLKTLPDGQ